MFHGVQHRGPPVVRQHVVSTFAGKLRRLLGGLGDKTQALAELEFVAVDKPTPGTLAVPGHDVTAPVGYDERLGQPSLHDLRGKTLVRTRLQEGLGGSEGVGHLSRGEVAEVDDRSSSTAGASVSPTPMVTRSKGRK